MRAAGAEIPYGQSTNQPRCKLLVASHFPEAVFSDLSWFPDTLFVKAAFGADISARRR